VRTQSTDFRLTKPNIAFLIRHRPTSPSPQAGQIRRTRI